MESTTFTSSIKMPDVKGMCPTNSNSVGIGREYDPIAVRRERSGLGGIDKAPKPIRNPARVFDVPQDDGAVLRSTSNTFRVRGSHGGDNGLFMSRTHTVLMRA